MSNYLSPLNTKLDSEQVLKRSYDETKNRIRVDAEVVATIGTVDVIIDAASGDSIQISDGVDVLLMNPDGSINVRNVQIFTKPFDAITRVYPDPSVGVEVYQSRLGGDAGAIQQTATVTYADGALKQEFLKVVIT